MIKEIVAAAILAVLIALSALDIHYVGKITTELVEMTEAAATEEDVQRVLDCWNDEEWFTHIAIRHSEIDLLITEFYNLRRDIGTPDGEITKARLIARLEAIQEMEKISFGTVF